MHAPDPLAGGGETGVMLRAIDWTDTVLGDVASWPPALVATLGVVLDAALPMCLAWGPALVLLYNDAFRALLGDRHPRAFGARARDGLGPLWATLGPGLAAALAGEPATVRLARATLACSPVRGGGALVMASVAYDALAAQLMQAPVGFALLRGPELVYELANPPYLEMAGRGADLVGKPIRAAFPELAPDAPVLVLLDQVFATGVPYRAAEYPVPLIRDASGVVKDAWFKFTAQAMRDAAGAITGVMIVALDVTADVAARRQAEAARALLEAVVQRMPAGVAITEAHTGRLLHSNARSEELLGWRAGVNTFHDAVARKADGTYYASADRPSARALRGEVVRDEEIVVERDGQDTFVSASAAPVYDAAHRLIAAVSVFWDITEQKRGEQQRQILLAREREARAEAEVASRTKDEFLAMLGHELRNPLAPILTALQLMELRGDAPLRREREIIQRQVDHLVRLVDDLLDVSRIAQGKIELRRAAVELGDVIARAIEMASPLIEGRRHALTLAVAPGLVVDGDAARLAQALANLLTNAAKFSEPGGRIAVTAAREDGAIVVRVRDHGIGIAPEVLPRVFELFAQHHQPSDRSQGGLGLGLAIVRSLIELHGGRVTAHSAGLGRGTELVVQLPALAGAPVVHPTTPAPALHAATRVLVVDDNTDAADLLGEALASFGYVTRVAYDGPSALLAAAELLPDVALLDLGLPVMDGLELARHLRELPGLEGVRLVALTGYGQPHDRGNTRAAGFAEHLVKPIDLASVRRAIEAAAR